MTRELAPPHHPIYRHRRQLQQVCELTDRIKLGLDVVIISWSLHYPSLPSFLFPEIRSSITIEQEQKLVKPLGVSLAIFY